MLLKNNKRVAVVRTSIAMAVSLALTTGMASAAPTVVAGLAPELVRTPTCNGEVGTPQRVEVAAGKSRFLRLSERVTRLTLGNDKIVDAKLISPTALYLVGAGVGSTNMILQGRHGCTVFDVIVQVDPGLLKATLQSVMPDEAIEVRTAGDSIVLSGQVSSAVAAERIESLARSYLVRTARNLDAVGGGGEGTSISVNSGKSRTQADTLLVNMMTVAAPQQVMLEVKVAEVSKTVLDQFGINFSRAYAFNDGASIRFLNGLLGGAGIVSGSIGGATNALVGAGVINSTSNGSATAASTAPFGSASIGGSTTTIPLAAGTNATTVGVDAQKQDGLVKVLAEPTVMAISGQEGSFLAGGKIFIPVTQTNGTGAVTYTLEEKEFGVSLRFRPTVLADGRINLEVNPEVSELSSAGVTIASSSVTSVLPAFTTRKASTTVQLFDGQSFAIGGLMKNNATTNISAFPVLGELPVIGALFRSTSFQTDRSELVFVITPRLVKPLPANYALPTDRYVEPTRADVIMRGKLEGTRNDNDASAPATGGGFDVK